MNNLLKKLTPPEPLGQCDSNFIGMFQTVRFIQMMSLTFGLFTRVSDSGPLGPLVVLMLYIRYQVPSSSCSLVLQPAKGVTDRPADGQMDRRTGPNQYASSTSSKLGA